MPGSPRLAPVTTTGELKAACAAAGPTRRAATRARTATTTPRGARRPSSTAFMQSLPAGDVGGGNARDIPLRAAPAAASRGAPPAWRARIIYLVGLPPRGYP